MVENVKIGKRYRVISDDEHNFEPNDIVVALEKCSAPACILEEHFTTVAECMLDDEIFYNYVYFLGNCDLEEIE